MELTELRQQIDEIDRELVSLFIKRMNCAAGVAEYKKEHNMPVLQTQRYDEIINERGALAEEIGLNPEFVKSVLRAIHEESVHVQVKVINE